MHIAQTPSIFYFNIRVPYEANKLFFSSSTLARTATKRANVANTNLSKLQVVVIAKWCKLVLIRICSNCKIGKWTECQQDFFLLQHQHATQHLFYQFSISLNNFNLAWNHCKTFSWFWHIIFFAIGNFLANKYQQLK